MSFLFVYGLFGLVTLLVVGIDHLWQSSGSWSSFLWRRRLLAELAAQRGVPRPWHDRLRLDVLLPLLT